jgi:RHS repeat-associated protein
MNLTWDSDNMLRSADIDANGTADVNFQYDALGRRVARSGTGGSVVYVQMEQQTIADYPVGGAATTPTFRYVYASYIDEPVVRKTAGTGGTLVYFHRNHQYSITAVTTSTGSIAERYAYTAYGQPTILDASASVLSSSAINNRYTYTGREWDATLGLHHFRARWMSPSAGRFLGRDPIGYEGSPNSLYEYVRARALISMDPKGLYQIADCVPDDYDEPPDQPWQGSCNIKVRCFGFPINSPFSAFCGNKGMHCGLILDDGAGRVVSLDGSGGCENNFDWVQPAYQPPGQFTGPVGQYPTTVCECLRQKAKTWNSIKIPRSTTGCNSNTSLRCLAGACGISGSISMPGNGCTPFRYDSCKEYNCTLWSDPVVCFGKSKRVCLEHEDFCTFYWRHANNGTVPTEPKANEF